MATFSASNLQGRVHSQVQPRVRRPEKGLRSYCGCSARVVDLKEEEKKVSEQQWIKAIKIRFGPCLSLELREEFRELDVRFWTA